MQALGLSHFCSLEPGVAGNAFLQLCFGSLGLAILADSTKTKGTANMGTLRLDRLSTIFLTCDM